MKLGLKKFRFDFIKDFRFEILALILGIFLLILPAAFGVSEKSGGLSNDNAPESVKTGSDNSSSALSFAESEEKRLEEILRSMKGVGKADVIIHVETSTKKVNASELKSVHEETDEGDSSGGKRVNSKSDENSTLKVLKDSAGNESLVHIYDEYPEIKGVMISAEGADSNAVKETIINAVSALYGIPVHKVSVVKRS